ncbi:MAG: DEAD/DEAH box helicase [Acidobacteria bacterium]|nr:DEAD/DEAH box helicase [Acidobacteriota bacterium]
MERGADGELEMLAAAAPPMLGAEYLTAPVLEALWIELGAAFQSELAESKTSVQEFLRRKSPAWNLVGRVLEGLRHPDAIARIDPGDALKTTLRPYQQAGVRWLHLLSALGLGACLADDMGLGKTMQVLGQGVRRRHVEGWCKPDVRAWHLLVPER